MSTAKRGPAAGRGRAGDAGRDAEAGGRRAHRRLLLGEVSRLRAMASTPRRRTMARFAEQEIVIPDGPFEGSRFTWQRQPFVRLWFEALEAAGAMGWNRFVATGGAQSGKTLSFFLLPTLYHLFEHGETVICGLTSMDMARDKWEKSIRPVIELSAYRDLIPRSGRGSKGGTPDSVTFGNGATLRFMTGGGGDKQRAGYTSRVLVVTEVDGFDAPGSVSVESDKISQLEARTFAFGQRRRIYMECTVTVETGRTWTTYRSGTASRIALPCPACGAYVTPDREHLVGWRDAADQVQASDEAAFCCPGCGAVWTEDDRRAANLAAVLVHKGQSVGAGGVVTGDPPRTRTLGFRWNAANNLLVTAADVAALEYDALSDPDEDNADRKLRMYTWALPHQPSVVDVVALTSRAVSRRFGEYPRNAVPDDADYVTAGVDLGKRLGHYAVLAWSNRDGGRGWVVDYGRFEVPSDDMAIEKATLVALLEFTDRCRRSYARRGAGAAAPQQCWVDCGWAKSKQAVYEAARRMPGWIRPIVGYGATQQRTRRTYTQPRKRGKSVGHISEGYHMVHLVADGVDQVQINADHWKSWVHNRLASPPESPGSLTLFESPDKNTHTGYGKHVTAERQIETFVAGVGTATVWRQDRRENHWLDATYIAATALHYCGARLIVEPAAQGRGTDEADESGPNPGDTARRAEAPGGNGGGKGFLTVRKDRPFVAARNR